MKYSKLAHRMREKISRFSGELCRHLGKTATRFVTECMYGILASESVMLTEIGRTLEGDVSLKKVVERFCRQLSKPRLWERLHRSLLAHGGSRVDAETLLIVDISDIKKKYARKMEYLAQVRDGSDDEISNGYWTLHVIGTKVDTAMVLPLYQRLYSQDSPGFRSENREILDAVSRVGDATDNRGIWVGDRGCDRDQLYTEWLSNRRRFVVRLVGTRDLIYRHKRMNALDLSRQTRCPFQDTIIKHEKTRERRYSIHYGYLPVRLPCYPDVPCWLVIVKGLGAKPMMLLTTERVWRSKGSIQRIIQSYVRRWSIEETIRYLKQSYDVENIRVLRYVCLENMMALVLAVFYFLAVIIDRNQKLRLLSGHILQASKRIFGIPEFKYYALSDGVCAILRRNPGKIIPKPKKRHVWQLALKFT